MEVEGGNIQAIPIMQEHGILTTHFRKIGVEVQINIKKIDRRVVGELSVDAISWVCRATFVL
jgi:hypothetical protein